MSNNDSGFSLSQVLEHFPPGATIEGITDGNGREYSKDEIKAIESLEREQMRVINQDATPAPEFSNEKLKEAIQGVLNQPTQIKEYTPAAKAAKLDKRDVKKVFFRGKELLAYCNDETLWSFNDKGWEQINGIPKTPPIPQD